MNNYYFVGLARERQIVRERERERENKKKKYQENQSAATPGYVTLNVNRFFRSISSFVLCAICANERRKRREKNVLAHAMNHTEHYTAADIYSVKLSSHNLQAPSNSSS